MYNIDYNRKMKSDRHPVTDAVHAKLIDLLEYWRHRGYSLEKIGELCDVPYTTIHGFLKTPGQSGYRGSRLTLDTVIKIWTGLGNSLETLFDDRVFVREEAPFPPVDLYQSILLEKQALEFDQKILETALQRKVASTRKYNQLLNLLSEIKKLIDDIDKILDKNRPVEWGTGPSPPRN